VPAKFVSDRYSVDWFAVAVEIGHSMPDSPVFLDAEIITMHGAGNDFELRTVE
jgi:hypothetical protein